MKLPEIESKILDVNVPKITAQLQELGAVYQFTNTFVSMWLAGNDTKFRVRKEGEIVAVEHKEMIEVDPEIKACHETGFQTQNLEATLDFFKKIGFAEISKSIKERTAYTLDLWPSIGAVEIVFDTYSDLDGQKIPTFIEIETKQIPEVIPEGSSVIYEAKNVIIQVAHLLGYEPSDLKDWSAKELSAHYRNI